MSTTEQQTQIESTTLQPESETSVQPTQVPHGETQGTEAEEAAAFAEGFAGARADGHSVAARGEPAEEKPAESAKPAPAEGQQAGDGGNDQAVEAAKVALAGLTEDQLKDLLARVPEVERRLEAQMQKVTGKLGEFNRTLQSLQQMQTSGRPSEQATARKIAGDMLKRTRQTYPDLADAIANDLNEIFSMPEAGKPSGQHDTQAQSAPAAAGPTPEQIAQYTQARIADAVGHVTRQQELKLLSMRHPDFQQVAASADFKLWAESLPAEDRAQVFSSEDALYVAEKLDAFKAFREQAAAQANAKKTTAQKRLAQAVAPTSGNPGHTAPIQTEEDAFLAGFAGARGA
jgi:hypothetical protein